MLDAVKNVILHHGGRLWAVRSVQAGAVFYFSFS
jgi:signal transduction histidine kinase